MTDPKIAALNRHIGRKLAKIMEARGITRAALSEATGISEARLARIAKGSSELSFPEAIVVARALGASPNHLSF